MSTADEVHEELLKGGYKDIPEAGNLKVGARVRHVGEQYQAAMDVGTGNIVYLMEKSPSSWVNAGWGSRDIEVVVVKDRGMFSGPTSATNWANYHTVVVPG